MNKTVSTYLKKNMQSQLKVSATLNDNYHAILATDNTYMNTFESVSDTVESCLRNIGEQLRERGLV